MRVAFFNGHVLAARRNILRKEYRYLDPESGQLRWLPARRHAKTTEARQVKPDTTTQSTHHRRHNQTTFELTSGSRAERSSSEEIGIKRSLGRRNELASQRDTPLISSHGTRKDGAPGGFPLGTFLGFHIVAGCISSHPLPT